MSQNARTLGVSLPQLIQLDDNSMTRVDLQGVILVHLIHLSRILLLHHCHDHSHGGGHLSVEHGRLILKSLGYLDLAHVLLQFVLEPQTEIGDVLFGQRYCALG